MTVPCVISSGLTLKVRSTRTSWMSPECQDGLGHATILIIAIHIETILLCMHYLNYIHSLSKALPLLLYLAHGHGQFSNGCYCHNNSHYSSLNHYQIIVYYIMYNFDQLERHFQDVLWSRKCNYLCDDNSEVNVPKKGQINRLSHDT